MEAFSARTARGAMREEQMNQCWDDRQAMWEHIQADE
jgi:hypothetical protein